MRVSLVDKDFEYFKRLPDLKNESTASVIEKIKTGGPMTRRVMCAELARREGALVVRKRK